MLLLFLALFIFSKQRENLTEWISKDGSRFCVDPDTQETSGKKLQTLNGYGMKLLCYIRDKYPPGSPQHNYCLTAIGRFDPDNFGENITEVGTAFVEDKGHGKFRICLKNVQGFHDMELLMFVYTHELAHIFNPTFGHDASFWSMFKWLLLEAEDAKLYFSPDFEKNGSVRYCDKVTVASNPRFSNQVKSYF